MKNFITLLIFLIPLTVSQLHSQKEWNNWYFGDKAAITFNYFKDEPIRLYDSPMNQLEGSASISTPDGNLVLISDGRKIWNNLCRRANQDDQLLEGNYSSTQSVFIINHPDNTEIYYIFTVGAWHNVEPPNTDFKYSTFDMTKDSGLTGLVNINSPLLSSVTEKLCATYHENRRDIWIMVHKIMSDSFYAYKLKATGLEQPVISNIGTALLIDSTCMGAMKFSPNGRKLAYVAYSQTYAEIFDFDNESGKLSNPVKIDLDGANKAYGLEFSPNSKVLYITTGAEYDPFFTLYQFNVQKMNFSAIASSKTIITTESTHIAALQLAPNGKIYIAELEGDLGVIAKPNALGASCDYRLNAVYLAPGTSKYGLPNTITHPADSILIKVCDGETVQLDPGYELDDTLIYPFHYEWNGPGGFHSTAPKPYVTDVTADKEGLYVLTGYYTISGKNYRIYTCNYVQIEHKLNFRIIGPTQFCTGEAFLIKPDILSESFKYLWNDGDKIPAKRITDSGTYKLYITHGPGCLDSAEIKITENPKPKARITGSLYICPGEEITLNSVYNSPDYTYHWSNGSTDSLITVNKAGNYGLKITNSFGCSDSTYFTVYKGDTVKLKLPAHFGICDSGTVVVQPEITNALPWLNYTYIWSTGDTTPSIVISTPGNYWVEVGIDGHCNSLANFLVYSITKPQVTLNVSDTVTICGGDSVFVEVTNYNPAYNYHWNDSVTAVKRYIKGSGTFTIYSDNSGVCFDSTKVTLINSGGPKFKILPGNNLFFCSGIDITLSPDTISTEWIYHWSTGDTTPSITINKTGVYILTITNLSGCSNTVTVAAAFTDNLPVSISGSKFFCEGDSVKLNAIINNSQPENLSYKWSTGEAGKSIYVKSSGNYSIEVTSEDGCFGSANTDITMLSYPDLQFNSTKYNICEGDSITVQPTNISQDFKYFWVDGYQNPIRIFSKSGTYTLIASNKNYCSDTAVVEIVFSPKPVAKIILFGDSSICEGESVELSAETSENYNDIRWSTGETSSKITVDTPGDYYLYTINSNECADTAKITIKRSDNVFVTINSREDSICDGSSTTLFVDGNFKDILWSDGTTVNSTQIDKPGTYSVVVTYSNGCKARDTIVISPLKTIVEPSAGSLDFSAVCQNSDMSKTIAFTNHSGKTARISGVSFAVGERYKLESPLDGLEIPDGGSISDNVIYRFYKEAVDRDTLYVFYDKPCYGMNAIPLASHIKNDIAVITPEFDFAAGADTCIIVIGYTECENSLNIGATIFEIKFRKNMFLPERVSPGEILDQWTEGDYRIVKISVPPFILTKTKTEIAKLCGIVTIGDTTSTTITIDNFSSESGFTDFSTTDGKINSTGCVISLESLEFFNLTELNVNPNPVKNTIITDISTQEQGTFNLQLLSTTGEILFKDNFENTSNNLLKLTRIIDATNLSDGVYYLKLDTPWGVVTKKLMVMKE